MEFRKTGFSKRTALFSCTSWFIWLKWSFKTFQANIGFAPLQHDIVIVDAPVRDINFQPVRADVEGRVVCLGGDCEAVQVSIVAADDAGNLAKTKKMMTGPKGEFKFEGKVDLI